MTTSKVKSVQDQAKIAGFRDQMARAKNDTELMEVGAAMAAEAGWRMPNAAEIIKGYVMAMEIIGMDKNAIMTITTLAAKTTRVLMRKNDGEDGDAIVADELGDAFPEMSAYIG